MDNVTLRLNVFFEDPFWVGVVEKVEDGKLSVSKVVFGPEPKSYQVYDYFIKNYDQLKFSPAVETDVKEKRVNPKRMQREVHKSVAVNGIGTKSQQALKLQQEQMKTKRKAKSRELKEAEKQRRFDLKQQKKKEKHRGR